MLDIRPLPKELEEAAKKNINEVPERREQDIAHIREWIQLQPHLVSRTDDQFLITFLRGCKFSLEKTKAKIDSYYTYRTALPEFYKNRDPMLPELQDIFDSGVFLPLGTDDEGRSVWLLRQERIKTDRHKPEDLIKSFQMMYTAILEEDDAVCIHGIVSVMDFHNTSLAHVGLWTPAVVRKSLAIAQNGLPSRIQGLISVNAPSICETLFNLVRTLLTEKLRKRMHIYSNMEPLFKHGLKKVLPKEYGGENESLEVLTKSIKKKLESKRQFFLDDDKYGVIESRRPGKPRSEEELLGMEGSFRKLRVD